MASISATMTMTTGETVTRTATVADQDVTDLIAILAAKYGMTESTSQDIFARWFSDHVSDTMNAVNQYRQQQAATAAAAAVAAISFTLT